MKEVEVSKLDLLKLDAKQVSWYHGIPIEHRKYAAVFEQGTRLYWLHHDLVSNGVVQLCNSCHRSLFHPKKVKCHQMPLLVASILVSDATYRS